MRWLRLVYSSGNEAVPIGRLGFYLPDTHRSYIYHIMKNLENKEKKHHRDVYKYKEKIKWRASNIKYR